MEGIAAEVSQKLKSAIRAKLTELGADVDDDLLHYVMLILNNRQSNAEMDSQLQLFLGNQTSAFISWMQSLWTKLDQVFVTNSGDEEDTLKTNPEKKFKSSISVGVEAIGVQDIGVETNPARVARDMLVERMKKLLVDSSVQLDVMKEACGDLVLSYRVLSAEVEVLRERLLEQTQHYQTSLKMVLRTNREFSDKQVCSLRAEMKELESRCASLKTEKENLTKITMILFSHSVLKTFVKRILVQLDTRLEKEQNAEHLNSAWKLFFTESSIKNEVKEAYQEITDAISSDEDIMLEVERINSSENESSLSRLDWFSCRFTNLYIRFSSIVNNMQMLDWAADEKMLEMVVEFIPVITKVDTALVSIVHGAILPFMRT